MPRLRQLPHLTNAVHTVIASTTSAHTACVTHQVPHLTNDEFSYMRGAFLTVDRPYGPIFDWFHHQIGAAATLPPHVTEAATPRQLLTREAAAPCLSGSPIV